MLLVDADEAMEESRFTMRFGRGLGDALTSSSSPHIELISTESSTRLLPCDDAAMAERSAAS